MHDTVQFEHTLLPIQKIRKHQRNVYEVQKMLLFPNLLCVLGPSSTVVTASHSTILRSPPPAKTHAVA
jgi:hypothetical protein